MADLPNTYLVSEEQRQFYDENGYLVIKRLLDFADLYNYKQRFLQICKGTVDKGSIVVVKESNLKNKGVTGEDLINKLHEIHNDDVFMTYSEHPRVLSVVSQFVGTDLRIMNGMFINKPPGSVEHPPHQDLYYFPFRPAEKIIAAWTAVDDVTVENGCLYVIPKSHKQGVLYPHKSLISPGDTVFFHPLLVHGSGPNLSSVTSPQEHRRALRERALRVRRHGGTVQEDIAAEIEARSRRRGFDLSFADTWRMLSKHITVPSKLCPVSKL